MIIKLVAGGQTGVDRGALNAALAAGVPCGGWCPKGRLAEDGKISECYPLCETPTSLYEERTEWNARDSDGTLILTRHGTLRGGTNYTYEMADRYDRACLVLDPAAPENLKAAQSWLSDQSVKTLNVAGPRESEEPGIQGLAQAFVAMLLHVENGAGKKTVF